MRNPPQLACVWKITIAELRNTFFFSALWWIVNSWDDNFRSSLGVKSSHARPLEHIISPRKVCVFLWRVCCHSNIAESAGKHGGKAEAFYNRYSRGRTVSKLGAKRTAPKSATVTDLTNERVVNNNQTTGRTEAEKTRRWIESKPDARRSSNRGSRKRKLKAEKIKRLFVSWRGKSADAIHTLVSVVVPSSDRLPPIYCR